MSASGARRLPRDTASGEISPLLFVLTADPNISAVRRRLRPWNQSPDNQIGSSNFAQPTHWKTAHGALPTDGCGRASFLGPEVYYIKERGRFLMYYSSDDRIAPWSDFSLGPFVQMKKTMLSTNGVSTTRYGERRRAGLHFLQQIRRRNDHLGRGIGKRPVTIRQETPATLSMYYPQTWEAGVAESSKALSSQTQGILLCMIYSGNSHVSQYYGHRVRHRPRCWAHGPSTTRTRCCRNLATCLNRTAHCSGINAAG